MSNSIELEDKDFKSSDLGTKEYWNKVYEQELKNFNESGDVGEIWFGKQCQRAVISWIRNCNALQKSDAIIDIGCGNGTLLIELRNMNKVPKSSSERKAEQRKRIRAGANKSDDDRKVYEQYKKAEYERVEAIRRNKVQSMSQSDLNLYRQAAAARKRLSRKRKAESSLLATPSENPASENPDSDAYRSRQALSKAVSRVKVSLPFSPRKKRCVVSMLAKEFEICETADIKNNPRANALSSETKENVKDFYMKPDISYTMPGMKDLMCIWDDEGNKCKLTKHYMNMFIREAYALYNEEFGHTDYAVKQSSFSDLRPPNVLLLGDTPKDQCKCQIYENFILKLEAMGTIYKGDLWKSILCDAEPNSDCWEGKCDECKSGKKYVPNKTPKSMTKYSQWETVAVPKKNKENEEGEKEGEESSSEAEKEANDDGKKKKEKTKTRIQLNTKEVFVGMVHEEFCKEFNKVSRHVNVKRIQAQEFEKDKADPKKRVLQIDYAMNFTSEWQDEIQSALWHRCSVTLFTMAIYTDNFERTALICSDCTGKGMETTWAFLNDVYDGFDMDSDDGKAMEEVIWSDGPTSEFKNRYAVEALKRLSGKFKKEFVWKFSATSHGKGTVDGVGGKAKSMVRAKMFAKKKEQRVVVQCPYDFYEAAKKLVKKTDVKYVSQETVSKINEEESIRSAVEVNGITKAHVLKVNNGKVTAWENAKFTEPFIVPTSSPHHNTPSTSQVGKQKLLKRRILDDDDTESATFTKIKKSGKKNYWADMKRILKVQKDLDDDQRGKFFSVYYDDRYYWGKCLHSKHGFSCLTGLDYSDNAITFAKTITEAKDLNHIIFETADVLQEDPTAICLQKQYQVCHDKGTYDAICLMPGDFQEHKNVYVRTVKNILHDTGFFIITSCNWTKDQLLTHFKGDFYQHEVIPTPSFQFGGSTGNKYTTLVLIK